jgi:hypothetical protein
MTPKTSRLLKIAGSALLVLAFIGYFTFSTLLFSPFEGGLANHVAGLVPRQVDFYVSKARLERDFTRFPQLALATELERNDAWRSFRGSAEYLELEQELGLAEVQAQLEDLAAQMPLGLDPLKIFGGRQFALAGHFRGPDLGQADWALYGTVNWAGKLALELLRYPGLLGLEKQGLTATVQDGFVALAGPMLARPLYLVRIKDVGVVSTSPELVRDALRLEAVRFEDSLFAKAEYNDYVRRANRRLERDEVEVFIDMRALLANQPDMRSWPDPKSPDVTTALLGRLVQLGSMNELVGVLGTGRTLTLDMRAPLSSEVITPLQRKLYRKRGSDTRELENLIAGLAPADTGFMLYVRGDVGDLARQVIEVLDPATRGLLEDAFRSTRRYQNLEGVLTEIDGMFRDRLMILVRENDYPIDVNAPPSDDTPVPAVALIAWTHDENKVVQFRELIGENGRNFGLQGVEAGELGFYRAYDAGYENREYTSPLVPGTGHILTVNYKNPDVTVITNTKPMLGHIRRTLTIGGAQHPRLADREAFQVLLRSARPEGNVLLWLDPARLGKWLRARAEHEARQSIYQLVDWSVERAKAEEQVLAERFPGIRRGQVPPDVREQVDLLVEPRLLELRERVARERVPELIAQSRRRITWLESVEAALVLIAFDPGALDISARVVLPLAPR